MSLLAHLTRLFRSEPVSVEPKYPILTMIVTESLSTQEYEWMMQQTDAIVDLACIRETIDTLFCPETLSQPYHDELVTGVHLNPFRMAHYMVTTLFDSGNMNVVLFDDQSSREACIDVWRPYCREHGIELRIVESDAGLTVVLEGVDP